MSETTRTLPELAPRGTRAITQALEALGEPLEPIVIETFHRVSGSRYSPSLLRDRRSTWLRQRGWIVQGWCEGASYALVARDPRRTEATPLLTGAGGSTLASRYESSGRGATAPESTEDVLAALVATVRERTED